MAKGFIFLTISLLNAANLLAQAQANWSSHHQFLFSVSNAQFSKYQTGGGQNNITFGTIVDLTATRKTALSIWDNNLIFAIGLSRLGSAQTDKFRKSDDRFAINTKFTSKINEHLGYTALADFRSQSLPGVEYMDGKPMRISNVFAPAYLELGVGATYSNPTLKINASPLGSKFTFVLDTALSNAGKFGVEATKKFRGELGARVEINLNKKVNDNLTVKVKNSLFMDYKNPKYIDVNASMVATLKATKYIKVIFAANYTYDHDIKFSITDIDGNKLGYEAPRSQFNNMLTIGLEYIIDKNN